MATYIQLLTFTPEGRAKALEDPESVLRVQEEIADPNARILGLYGVLGEFDLVAIVDASDNEAVARFSIQLGVRAGVHITTLPAVPVARLEASREPRPTLLETAAEAPLSGQQQQEGDSQ